MSGKGKLQGGTSLLKSTMETMFDLGPLFTCGIIWSIVS